MFVVECFFFQVLFTLEILNKQKPHIYTNASLLSLILPGVSSYLCPSQHVHLHGNQEGIGQLGTVVGVVYFLLMN